MRKSILRFGALALMSMMSISAFAQKNPGDTFWAQDNLGKYKVIEDNDVELVEKGTKSPGTIPSSVKDDTGKDYDVVAIGSTVFKDFNSSAIKIPASVTKVGDNAFFGAGSTTNPITIVGDGIYLKEVGSCAFYNATFAQVNSKFELRLENIKTGDNSISLQSQAFSRSNITSVIWPERATVVPDYAFESCTSLKTFKIDKREEGGDYLNTIGSNAFNGCEALDNFGWLNSTTGSTEYYLPKTLVTIGTYAFKGCKLLEKLQFTILVQLQELTINHHAFEGCEKLNNASYASVTQKAKKIQSGAFMGCKALTAVTIPATTKFEDKDTGSGNPHVADYDGVFEGCTGLLGVTFPINGSDDVLGINMFKDCTSLNSMNYFMNLAITEIPDGAFQGCTALAGTIIETGEVQVFAFPGSVKTIGNNAFAGCESIENLRFPESLITIGDYAFASYTTGSGETAVTKSTTFTSVTFPANVTKIGRHAFYGNSSITAVEIIGKGADAANHKKANYVECLDDDVFGYLTTGETPTPTFISSATLTVPYGCYDDYVDNSTYTSGQNVGKHKNPTWYKFSSKISTVKAGYNDNGSSDGDKFWVGGLCYEVTKNDGKSLAEVKVVDGRFAIQNPSTTRKSETVSPASNRIDNIKFNETTKNIQNGELLGTEIVIPQYVVTNYDEALEYNAFYKVTGLQSVNAQDLAIAETDANDLKVFKNATRSGIEAVTTVTIKAAGIEVPAIFNCVVPEETAPDYGQFKALATFKTDGEGSIESLADAAFKRCENLETVKFKPAEGFTKIASQAFSMCSKLKNFSIPTSVKTIGAKAFYKSGLENIVLPAVLQSISSSAFQYTALTSINIPSLVKKIGADAFSFTYSKSQGEQGVKNVYFNWDATNWPTFGTEGIEDNAFGTAMSETKGDKTIFHLRNLHYPSGQSAKYLGVDMFKEAAHLFNTVEGIKVNGKNKYLVCSDNPNEDPSIVLEDATNVREDLSVTTSVSIARELPVKVTYMREFDSDKWQCWFVPFNYEYTEKSPAKFAYLYDTKLDDNGYTMFEYKEVPEGTTIKANVPYLVKPNAIDDIPFYADNLQKTQPTDITVSDAKNQYTFSGVYTEKEYDVSEETKWYGLLAKTGVFHPAEPGAYINAYRFYMTVSPGTNPYGLVKVVVLDDEDATGIMDINAQSLNAPMFDLMGRQIVAPAKGQVYIQNGVKKLAK